MIGLTGDGRLRRGRPTGSLLTLAVLATTPLALAAGVPTVAPLSEVCSHLLRVCFAALVRFDVVLHGAPVVLLCAGVAYAGVRRVRSIRRGSAVVRRLRSRSPRPGERLHQLAVEHRALAETRILLGCAPNPAFTAGLLRPRLHLAEGLLRELSDAELQAVFLHELHHVRRRDPLRGTMAGALADLFFWLPLVRDGASRIQARMEFAADDAARPLGDLVVAGALLRVAEVTNACVSGAPPFAAPNLLEQRIERLLGTPAADRLPASPPRVFAASTVALILVWLIGVASSGSHAAHVHGTEDHCPHHHVHGILHADGPRSTDHSRPSAL